MVRWRLLWSSTCGLRFTFGALEAAGEAFEASQTYPEKGAVQGNLHILWLPYVNHIYIYMQICVEESGIMNISSFGASGNKRWHQALRQGASWKQKRTLRVASPKEYQPIRSLQVIWWTDSTSTPWVPRKRMQLKSCPSLASLQPRGWGVLWLHCRSWTADFTVFKENWDTILVYSAGMICIVYTYIYIIIYTVLWMLFTLAATQRRWLALLAMDDQKKMYPDTTMM